MGLVLIMILDCVVEYIFVWWYVEKGICCVDIVDGIGWWIGLNYFDLVMIMDYWFEKWLNYYIEVMMMLYGVWECVWVVLGEGFEVWFVWYVVVGCFVVVGVCVMGLMVFGVDVMWMINVIGIVIFDGVDGEWVWVWMWDDFEIEIGSVFGLL